MPKGQAGQIHETKKRRARSSSMPSVAFARRESEKRWWRAPRQSTEIQAKIRNSTCGLPDIPKEPLSAQARRQAMFESEALAIPLPGEFLQRRARERTKRS